MTSESHSLSHPLVEHHLAVLRDSATPPDRFRASVRRLSLMLGIEATRDLKTAADSVETPVASADCMRLAERVAVVPILRAGHGMVDALLTLIPTAEVWHLGVYRDEQTLQPVEYYHKLPAGEPPDVALVIDPMLATGGSAVWAMGLLRRWGVPRVKLLSLIAAPEGVQRVSEEFPDAEILVCKVDRQLNEHGYIVPGLGDAGDRYFNTRPGG